MYRRSTLTGPQENLGRSLSSLKDSLHASETNNIGRGLARTWGSCYLSPSTLYISENVLFLFTPINLATTLKLFPSQVPKIIFLLLFKIPFSSETAFHIPPHCFVSKLLSSFRQFPDNKICICCLWTHSSF